MNHRLPEKIIATKTVDVADLNSVKFVHNEVHRGWFSDTVETYDAVKYGNRIFRLQYDLESESWIGEKRVNYPNQGAYYQDFAEHFISTIPDWEFCRE